jgi:hypothetical protein
MYPNQTSARSLVRKNQRRDADFTATALRLILAGTVIGFGASHATEFDLSASGSNSYNVTGAFGGTAVFSDFFTQPAGTGVFEPFLTIDANGQTSSGTHVIEQGYNTDGSAHLYLDQLRPNWNKTLRLSDLATLTVSGKSYYGFELDANEPGGNKSLISVDNVRVYTSASDTTGAVQNNLSSLDSLGTLRWALNNPTKNADGSFNINTWIKLDAAQENVDAGSSLSNGGSGKSDMIVYIPVSAFAGASANDYVWFYNLNGVHYDADADLAATSGFEEWRAVTGPQQTQVPDGGSTLALVGAGLLALGAVRRKL